GDPSGGSNSSATASSTSIRSSASMARDRSPESMACCTAAVTLRIASATLDIVHLAFRREVAAVGLHEPGFRPLRVDLPQDGAVQRGGGRLAAGAAPQALGGH